MVVLVLAALVVVLAGGTTKQLYMKFEQKKLNKELHGPIHKMRFKSNLNFLIGFRAIAAIFLLST